MAVPGSRPGRGPRAHRRDGRARRPLPDRGAHVRWR